MYKKTWCTSKVVVLLMSKPIAFLPFSLLSPSSLRNSLLLDVTCCVRLHTLLHVIGRYSAKFEGGQMFEPITPNISFVPWSLKRSATMLDPFAQLFQHCWGQAHAWHMVSKVLGVVSFPRCTAGTNIVGTCCIRLHTTANTDATTPKIVGPTMSGVVSSVCT